MIKITGLSAWKKVPLAWLGMVPEAITRHVGARLESVSLTGFCPSQLSGGQRQRVAIARAGPRRCWSTRPRSDSGGQRDRNPARSIWVIHDEMEVVRRAADAVAQSADGRLILSG